MFSLVILVAGTAYSFLKPDDPTRPDMPTMRKLGERAEEGEKEGEGEEAVARLKATTPISRQAAAQAREDEIKQLSERRCFNANDLVHAVPVSGLTLRCSDHDP